MTATVFVLPSHFAPLPNFTLQTGNEYRELIGLDDSELAVLIGSRAVLELHSEDKKSEEGFEDDQFGSESWESLLSGEIDYFLQIPEEKFYPWF